MPGPFARAEAARPWRRRERDLVIMARPLKLGDLVAPGVRTHDETQHPPSYLPEVRAEGILVIPGEVPDHTLDV